MPKSDLISLFHRSYTVYYAILRGIHCGFFRPEQTILKKGLECLNVWFSAGRNRMICLKLRLDTEIHGVSLAKDPRILWIYC